MKGSEFWVWVTCGEDMALGIGDTEEEAREDAMAALLALQMESERLDAIEAIEGAE